MSGISEAEKRRALKAVLLGLTLGLLMSLAGSRSSLQRSVRD